ncbi:MAG: transposase family protein [Sphingobacteriales bacterium]|nr:transposase family protein [Sphingobacteriales bacterium]
MERKTEKKRRKYDADFKREVLTMVSNGRSVLDISQSLGIGSNLIHKWKSRSNPATASSKAIAPTLENVSCAEHEKLKAKVRQLEQERDILKKALGIFSRED